MAYDPATDAAALRAEVVDNQAHYGDPGSTRTVLAKLNDPALARTAANSTAREFSGDDLVAAIVAQPVEHNSAVDGFANADQVAARKLFVDRMVAYGPEAIPARFHATILAVYTNALAPTIRAKIIAEATGPQSQAEQLFGDDTLITRRDWVDARGPSNADGSFS